MNNHEIVVADVSEVNTSLTVYENKMLGYMASLGLPVDNILVPISERKKMLCFKLGSRCQNIVSPF